MKKIFLGIIIGTMVSACSLKSNNDSQADQLANIPISTDSTEIEKKIEAQFQKFEELRSKLAFQPYDKWGFILPCETLDLYSDSLSTYNAIHISAIQPILITAKSNIKMPETPDGDYCTWANYVKGHFKDEEKAIFYGQEKIISGRWAYEIVQKYSINMVNGDSMEIDLVRNFSTGSVDHDGLTGCDDYRIILINDLKQAKVSFVNVPNEKSGFPTQYARLFENEGVKDNISKIEIKNDTIVLKIISEYQEGGGTHSLNIVRSGDMFNGFETDRTRKF